MRTDGSVARKAAAGPAAAFLLPALVLFSSGCGNPLIQGAVLHFEAGRFDRAAEVFEKAVAQNPMDAGAHLWLARCYSELGRVKEAVLEYDRAVSLDSSLEPEAVARRLQYWRVHYARGEGLIREALVMDAISSQKLDRLSRAAEALENALVLAPQEPATYLQLFRLAQSRGDSIEAEKQLAQSIARIGSSDVAIAAELVPVLKDRGRRAAVESRYEDAVLAYEAAARLRPSDVDLMMDLASAYLLAAQAEGTPEQDRASDYRRAGEVLERVRAVRPTDPDAIFNLANVRLRTGEAASADSLIRTYLVYRPRDPEAYELLESAAAQLGHSAVALAAGLAFKVLLRKQPVSEPDVWARRQAEKLGSSSAPGRLLEELGTPEEIHTLRQSDGAVLEVWLYVKKGRTAVLRQREILGEILRFETRGS
jgi:tetratricopeptide (TPR) repeat protein